MTAKRSPDSIADATCLHRRNFLKLGVFAAAGLLAAPAFAKIGPLRDRPLAFYNMHTGESLRTDYWAAGRYVPEGLAEINYILRDHRTNEVKAIDPALLDLLYALQRNLGSRQAFHIISGYRSPATNAFLHAHSNGVATHSLHMDGMAADIFLPDRSLHTLRAAAVELGRGGVGYYPASNFVHVDVGRVRYW
ncbi:MAG: DUF882 domain-containing protein [Gammaproteobacteria bacterium]